MVTSRHTQQLRQAHHNPVPYWLAGALLLVPVVVFWYVWATYAVNVPKWDDHALKFFLASLNAETSFSGKLYQFFRQHNEHRIVYDRLISWLDYHLSGKLNFTHLMAIGNLSLLGLLAIFSLVLRQATTGPDRTASHQRPAYGLAGMVYVPPVAFLLLNLSQWENMFWGMAALQNFTVIVWVFWVIYLLTFPRKVGPALLLAIAATLTSGNGLLIWPVGFGILALQQLTQYRPAWKPLLVWTLIAGASIALYFLNYEKPAGNPPERGSLAALVTGWFAFTGSAAEAIPTGSVIRNCVLLGGLLLLSVLGAVVFISRKWLRRRTLTSPDYFFVGSAVFLVCTGILVAWTRTGFGINTLITSRYKFYSLLLLAVLYTYLVGQLPATGKKWGFFGGLLVSVILMVCSYRTYLDETIWWRQWMLTNQFNWSYTASHPELTLDSNTVRLLENAPAFYDSVLPSLYQPAGGPVKPFSSLQKKGTSFLFADTLTHTPAGPDAGTYILLRSDKRLYLLQTTPELNLTWRAKAGLAPLYRKGFTGSVTEADLLPGVYLLERLRVNENGSIDRSPTGQRIVATAQAHSVIPKNW